MIIRPRRLAVWAIPAAAGIILLFSACGSGKIGEPASVQPVIGVKIYETAGPFDNLFREWRGLGVNTLFMSEALLKNADFRGLVRANGMTLFLIFPVFQNPEALKEDPGLAAVTSAGAPAREEWVEFVCPAREDYLSRRAGHLRDLVAEFGPDVVSLDFIRYFVFWEKVAPDRAPESLPQTCFCPVCLAGFEKEMGARIPSELVGTAEKAKWILETRAADWTEWKCRVIARAVERLAAAARRAKPAVKVNIHAVPWRKGDFGGAARSIAGQDLARLAAYADFISPMCYHHMVRQSPAWVHDVVADLYAQTHAAILASTQVSEAYVENTLAPGEFRAALEEALKPPSVGVVLWSWDALSKSPEKREILKSSAGLKKKRR
jgi:hypothetical protein